MEENYSGAAMYNFQVKALLSGVEDDILLKRQQDNFLL